MPEEILQPDTNYLMDLLKKIISFKTVAPPGSNYRGDCGLARPHLSGYGLCYAKAGHAPGRLRGKMQ